MANQNNKSLKSLSVGSRLVVNDGGSSGGFDAHSSNRGNGRSRGRSRRNRFSKQRFQRGRADVNRDGYRGPLSFEEWKRRLELDGPDAYWDLKTCFSNTGIPFLENMELDMFNPGVVFGQRLQAIMMAAIRSMILGRVVHPDGSSGKRININLIEDEMARLDSCG